MGKPDQHVASQHTRVATATYYAVSLLLLPVTLLGYLLWIKNLFRARNTGASATAQGPLSARWLQHQLGTRPDLPAAKILPLLPSVSPLAVWLVFGPTLAAHRISGYVPPAFRYPFRGEMTLRNQAAARQTFYDAVVDRYLPTLQQFVMLGAGFDTRALRLPEDTPVCSFEVDTPTTLALKQQVLKAAQVDPVKVTFVAADFAQEDWLGRLVAAGFDPGRPALFLWEGVTPYLDRAAVMNTLRTVASTARGSVLAFDYFTTEIRASQSLSLRLVRAALTAGGEPLKFGIASTPPLSERVNELLASCQLTLVEQHTMGKETDGKLAVGGFAVGVVR